MNERDAEGKVQAVIAIAHDITELKRMEEELRRSENLFGVLIENSSSGVALIDENVRFTIYNSTFLKMFGLYEDPSHINNVNDQNWTDWHVFEEDGSLLNVDDHLVRKITVVIYKYFLRSRPTILKGSW